MSNPTVWVATTSSGLVVLPGKSGSRWLAAFTSTDVGHKFFEEADYSGGEVVTPMMSYIELSLDAAKLLAFACGYRGVVNFSRVGDEQEYSEHYLPTWKRPFMSLSHALGILGIGVILGFMVRSTL